MSEDSLLIRIDKENSQIAVHLSSVGAAFFHAYTQRRISLHTLPNDPQKHHNCIPPGSTTTTRINEVEDRGDGERGFARAHSLVVCPHLSLTCAVGLMWC
jgi:hypothetical protein